MAPALNFYVLKTRLMAALMLAGVMILILMFLMSVLSPKCEPLDANSRWSSNAAAKPIVLLWFWPENNRFDFQDCKRLFNIDSCSLTDSRSLYSRADAVLIFHRAIQDNPSNLPTSPRPKFQRWIWFNMDSPNNTRRIAGIERLFNLTLSYRKDADIPVRWKLTIRKKPADDVSIPKKQRLLCWSVNEHDLRAGSGERFRFYTQLEKYIKVHVFYSSSAQPLSGDKYFETISSCKFFLSFENSINRDYITEIFTDPLAVGTVPIVLGLPRNNYENFAPASSFIHVNDFSDAKALAEFLLKLDEDDETYRQFFDWRRFYTVRRHFTEKKHEFAHAICQACHHVSMRKEYRMVPDVYKWFFM